MRFVSSFVLAFVVGLAMASNKAEASFVTVGDAYWSIWNVACAGQPEEDWWDCASGDTYSFNNVGITVEKDGAYAGYSAGGSVSQTSPTADLFTVSAEFSDYAYSFANDDSVFAFAGGYLDHFYLSFAISEEVYVFVERDLTQTLFSGLLPPGTHGLDLDSYRGSSSLSGPADLGGFGTIILAGIAGLQQNRFNPGPAGGLDIDGGVADQLRKMIRAACVYTSKLIYTSM